jgi:hypothetical protein
MTNIILSPKEKSVNAQPPMPAAPSKQSSIAENWPRHKVARRAYTLALNQGASSAHFRKLNAERPCAAMQFPNEIQVWRYSPYAHGGLND